MKLVFLKKNDANMWIPLMRWHSSSTSFGNRTCVFVNFASETSDISNFVAKSKTIPSCKVSFRRSPSDVSTDAASPAGDRGFLYRKLPYSNVVAIAMDTEHSIPSASITLFSIT